MDLLIGWQNALAISLALTDTKPSKRATGRRPTMVAGTGQERPGSPEAKAAGCKCPAMDNHHGRGHGFVHPDNGWDHAEWVISTRCKLHGKDLPR